MRRLRVGRISLLNMYPIYHGLERAAEPMLSFTDGVPTALNDALLRGELDVSAVSSIAYARHATELSLLPVASITADGAVDSIQVFSRVPFEDVRSVAVTPHSATSVALDALWDARVVDVMTEHFGARPVFSLQKSTLRRSKPIRAERAIPAPRSSSLSE